jgi:CubicO group peptidase (beta-lactamase class C family)
MAQASVSNLAAKPEDVGIDGSKLEALFARVKRDVDEGLLPSAQVAIARKGQLAGFRTFGNAVQGGATRPATNETLYIIYSATKGIVGAAVWTLFDDGLLRRDEKVAGIIPEFGTNGKENITVEETMLHIGGFPMAPFRAEDWDDRERRLQRFSQWRLNWETGSQFQYHATSAHWTMAEIIERKTGMDFRDYVRERVITPAGVTDLYVGLPAELNDRVAEVVHVVPPEPPPGGFGEVTPDAVLNFNKPEIRAIGVPGGGGAATAAAIALFYQPLVNGGVAADGTRLMSAETIDMATTPRTTDIHTDPLFGHPVNRALAMVVAGDEKYRQQRGFSPDASPRAFGHGGAGGQIAWGDPETGMSLGFCTNGFRDLDGIRVRSREISRMATDCLLP